MQDLKEIKSGIRNFVRFNIIYNIIIDGVNKNQDWRRF